ncbi:nitroreductase family protein [Nonomuraea sp. NPDC050536]|uniref:nitroreductase family protein n=1 Tax=Nonomuraea sp. NPDC050536 TaxID=3364366 RepID=UPI0037C7A013
MAAEPTIRPVRLCLGLVVVRAGEQLVVEGARYRHVFRGAAATEVLPRLLPLLDGSHDDGELCELSGLSPPQLRQVLTLLGNRGLLDEAETPAGGGTASEEVVAYLSRTVGARGDYSGSGRLLGVLAGAAVALHGDERITSKIAHDLLACGVGSVSADPLPPHASPTLAVVVDGADDPTTFRQTVASYGPLDVPVLRVAADAGHVEIGPCFFPGVTACPACLARGREEMGWEAPSGVVPVEALAGWAAAEALAIAGRLPELSSVRSVTRVSLQDWTSAKYLVVPYADCRDCGPAANLADAYEWEMRPPPFCLMPDDDRPPVEMAPLTDLMTQRPGFTTHPRLALPEVSEPVDGIFCHPVPADGTPLDEKLLADLLARVAGLRRGPSAGRLQRWVPSGGNLASVEAYVVVEDGVAGLPGTVFRYSDLTHELIAVRPERVRHSRILEGTGLAAGNWAAVLVLVAARGRLGSKYGQFASRLALLDAGCATTQLAAVAQARGLGVEFAAQWGERLAEVLRLVADDQFVTAVAGIRRPPSEGGTACP